MIRSQNAITSILVLLCAAVVAGGCGTTSFVSQKYEDFTAYYNKFYNAQRSFKEADKLQSAARPVDRQLIMTVFPIADRASSSREYENAIRKSADVLRGHENSKWVDDALMLIGRAYFNQKNFVSAEQKFREVMALDTKLRDEARYWLARSQIAGNQYESAHANLEEALAEDGISRKWRPYLHLVLGELRVREGDYAEAAESLREGLRVKDRRLAARAQFLLGQVNEKLGNYDEAIDMYRRVGKHRPPYELEYAAQVRAIEVEALYGDSQEADRALRNMERDDKNYENRHELAIVRAKLQAAQNQPGEAVTTLVSVLRSSTPPQPPIRGAAHYTLAQLYRDVFRDYRRAAAHFDTASTALQGQIVQRRSFGLEHSIADPFAPGAISDVIEETNVFRAYATVAARVGRMDSLMALGTMEESAFRERIEEIRQIKIAEMKEQDRLREQQDVKGQFNNRSVATRTGLPEGKVIDYDPDVAAAGFLFHKEPVRVQQAFQLFRQKWGDRPHVPGWRVSNSITGASAVGSAVDSTLLAQVAGKGEDRYANVTVNISDVPRSQRAQNLMRADRAIARYEMGNVLFLSMDLPDSAASWYQLVIDEDDDQPVAARAHYALAEVYRLRGMEGRAEELLDDMATKYPEIDPTVIEEDTAPTPGVLANDEVADAAYEQMFELWQEQQYRKAVVGMLETARAYPEASVAPRALLAVGSIAGDWARRDSLDLLMPLPVVVRDSLLDYFGWTPAADTTTGVGPPADVPVEAAAGLRVDSTAVDTTAGNLQALPQANPVADSSAARPGDAVREPPEEQQPALASGASGDGEQAAGDPVAGDPAAGDPVAGDRAAGDPTAGDPTAGAQDSLSTDVANPPGDAAADSAQLVEDRELQLAGIASPMFLPHAALAALAAANDDESAGDSRHRVSVVQVYEYLGSTYPTAPAAVQARQSLDQLRQQVATRQAHADSLARERAALAAAAASAADTIATGQPADSALVTGGVTDSSAVYAGGDSVAVEDSVVAGDKTSISDKTAAGDTTAAGDVTEAALPDKRKELTEVGPPPGDEAATPQKERVDARPDSNRVNVRDIPGIIDAADADVLPELIGGDEALMRAIGVGQFPDEVSGSVEVTFVVTSDGRVSQVVIEKGLSELVDREVTRAVYQSRFRPGTKDNRLVPVRMKRSIEITVE